MDFPDFKQAAESNVAPPNLPAPLRALLRDAAGDWNGAHEIAQDDPSADGSWVHAYLHRKEGDLGNASYWYTRAGRTMPASTLDEEWEAMARELLRSIPH